MKALTAQTTARDLKVLSSDGEKLYGGLYTAVITAVNEQEATASSQQNSNSSIQVPTQEQEATTPNSASAPKKNKM